MKRLLLLISFTFLFLYSFSQTDVQRDNRVSPILKQALASKSGYYIYGRNGTAGFINIAVLNQSSGTLCWFTCHGRFFDSTKLTVQEFEQGTSKQIDPFLLYQNICDKYLADIAAANDIYRVYGDIQLLDKLNGNYRALFAMESVQAAKTPLQKIIAVENVRKKILTQLAYLNCVSPFGLHNDPLYKISKDQAGAMIQSKDSTVYYNIDPTSAVAKISLYKKTAGQLYIQNRFSEIIDSVGIQPEKYDLLQKEKTDVFLLYRGWLEMRWQGALAAIRQQRAGPYNQVNVQSENSNEPLYSQFNAIEAKINRLNSPEVKSIEQAIYDTYKNETSEISYIPLLGVGYSLNQTRGQKEYELSNQLGNVLVTVTDKKIGVSSNFDSSLIDHYEPDIVSAQDYYPFGMLQPGRSFLSSNGNKYRYGFNGKENDNEVKGEGNQQDYGMRVYDPRLGRFLSVDPLAKSYAMLTPYQFAGDNPVNFIDIDGLEPPSQAAQSIPAPTVPQQKVPTIPKGSNYGYPKNLDIPDKFKSPIERDNNVGAQRANLLLFILNTFTSPSTPKSSPDEVYKEYSTNTDDLKDNQGFDNMMVYQHHFFNPSEGPDKDVDKDDKSGKYLYIQYTNRKSIVGIAATQTIYPNKKDKIYLTKKLFSEEEAEQILFLNQPTHKGKGKYMVVFMVDADQNTNIKKDEQSAYEYIHQYGSLKIRPGNMIYIGPNVKKNSSNNSSTNNTKGGN